MGFFTEILCGLLGFTEFERVSIACNEVLVEFYRVLPSFFLFFFCQGLTKVNWVFGDSPWLFFFCLASTRFYWVFLYLVLVCTELD